MPSQRTKEAGDDDRAAFLHQKPGQPLELIYGGSESPVRLSDVSRHLSSARKRRRPIDHLGFLGCRFVRDDSRDAAAGGGGTSSFFRALGRKLRRVSVSGGLSICGMPDVGDDEVESLAPFFDGGVGGASSSSSSSSSSGGRGASSLRSLDLTGATITAGGIETGPLGRFLRRSSSLEVLAVGENPFLGDDGASAVVRALASRGGGGGLRVLAMGGCGIGPRGVYSISRYLSHRPSGSMLRVLELGGNDVGDVGAGMLADALVGRENVRRRRRHHHRLVRLGLADSGIGDAGALALSGAIASNGSLVALSLRDNVGITDVGASGLLGAVYDDASIERIVGSNHVLRDLDLRGCGRMSPSLLRKAAHLSARLGSPCTEGEVVQLKVSAHLKDAGCGVPLEDYDLELMPHILAFVGKACGMTSLFDTLKGMPNFYTKNDPQVKCLAGEDQNEEKKTTFLDQFKLSSRRSRKFYTSFVGLIPRRCSMLRYHDRRTRNGHESTLEVSSGENNSRHNISLDSCYTTDALF
ncbi:hypothetical protein ACHAW5_008307 [Stephanodiscus triporus]|uniref:Uncharacterized protein n=1 Tax=Stephanodiscus triporus TaxID=2934178 RepID=A0ABD3NSE4_9STRA